MNYGNQNLRELMAGEYILGLLRGAARRRFERLLIEDSLLRAEVTAWEEKFAAWNRSLRPLTPPSSVWRRLQAHIKVESIPVRASRLKVWWSGAVAVAATAMLIIGIFIGRSVLAPSLSPVYLSVMSTAQGQPRWLITVHPQTRHLDMKALTDNTPPSGKSYELWMLPASGKPISMGLMNNSGSASETVSADVIDAIVAAKGLAISVEPEGGSPTGQPTGPVIFVAPLIHT